jgi:hypothetical protein
MEDTMPIYMHYDGIDGDVTGDGRGSRDADFATGETLVHVEAAGHGSNEMILDDTAGDDSNVEVLVKILDGRPASEPPLHVEAEAGWMLM